MKRNFLTLLLAVLLPVSLSAENIGLSLLGMCNRSFPCEAVEKHFENSDFLIFRWLDGGTFGNECRCVAQILSSEKSKIVAPHIANSTCFKERGRVCNEDEVFFGETIASANSKILAKNPALLERFDEAAVALKNRLLASTGNLTAYISPCLECNLSAPSRAILLERTKQIFEQQQPILTPAGYIDNPLGGQCLEGYLCEQHGKDANSDIVDLDGDDYREVDTQAYLDANEGNILRFVWAKEFNCIGESGFVDPRKRWCQASLPDAVPVK